MLKSQKINQSGFTLIELVVAIAIFSILALGIISLVSNILRSSSQQSGLISDQDQARKVAFQLMTELRNSQSGLDGSYSIAQAGDQQLIFFSQSPDGSTVWRLRYYLSGGNMYRAVIVPTGSVYNVANETSVLVARNVANGGTPLFYYYDGNYNNSTNTTALAQPVNLNSVKYVKLNLKVYNNAGVTNTNTYTVTAGAAIRNLKNNLGN